jgi:uncharacterized damage-inducible protein DinB
MGDLIADLFRQNEWANLTVIDACRGLTDEQLDATAVGAFGSVRETLVHFIGAEARYVRRLGGAPARDLPRDEQWTGFDALEQVVRSTAAALLERARSVAGSTLELTDIADDDPARRYHVDATVVLVQALNHSTEHRSQLCTILTGLGIAPPELDGWTWGIADGRTRPVAG